MQLDDELEAMPDDVIESVDQLLLDAFEQDFEAKLVKKLRAQGLMDAEHILPVSEEDDEILAYIGYTRVHIDGCDELDILGLAPMAVAPNAQGSGVGLDFLIYSISAMAEEGVDAIVLLGHKEFYSKAGFRPATEFNLKFSDDPAYEDAFMSIELTEGSLSNCSGIVTYAPDFYENN